MVGKILFPDEHILVTKHFDAHQDWEIPIPGFFIVASVRKVRCITDLSEEEAIDMISVVREVRTAMRVVLGIKDIYLFQNEDTEHGFHVWMFPRYDWMEPFGRRIQSVRPIMDYAKEHLLDEASLAAVHDAATKVRAYIAKSTK